MISASTAGTTDHGWHRRRARTACCAAGAVVLAVLGACKQRNPLYCDDAVHHLCVDAGALDPDALDPDALDPGGCVSNRDCLAPLGVCDLTRTNVCVQCTEADHEACTGATPVCVDHTCQPCTEHAHCADSNVCLPDGSCADAAQVAYVDVGGGGSACTRQRPCGSLAAGLASNRPLVKINQGPIFGSSTTGIRRAVTIVAEPGASLFNISGDVIEINGAVDVRIYDLEIEADARSAITVLSGANVSLTRVKITGAAEGQGAVAASGSTLTIARSTISDNQGFGISVSGGTLILTQSTITINRGGGIYVQGAEFNITNNVIANNDTSAVMAGAVNVSDIITAGLHTLEFNTIADNEHPAGVAAINCTNITAPLTFSNNIVYGNDPPQVGGTNCAFTYSDIGPIAAAGTGNISGDPMFINPTDGDYHLGLASQAKDKADPAATIGVDIDGEPRPQGARRDMGADEVKP